jgi:hypothetical protein
MVAPTPNSKQLIVPHKTMRRVDQPNYGQDMRQIEQWAEKVVMQLKAGSGITLSPSNGLGQTVTISASGGTGGGCLTPVALVETVADSSPGDPPSGAATIDGQAVVTGQRILVTTNLSSPNNGVWLANTAGAWTRPTDFANGASIPDGTIVPVSNWGNNFESSLWILVNVSGTPAPIVVGTTTPIEFFGLAGAFSFQVPVAGVSAPTSTVQATSIFDEPFALVARQHTGAYQMDGTIPVIVGNGAVTLPTAASTNSNTTFTIKDNGAGTLVIHPHGADTIDGSASTITPGAYGVRRLIAVTNIVANGWYTI